jgi:hypothetical protein
MRISLKAKNPLQRQFKGRDEIEGMLSIILGASLNKNKKYI